MGILISGSENATMNKTPLHIGLTLNPTNWCLSRHKKRCHCEERSDVAIPRLIGTR